jgi:hypothetical protein
LGELQEILSTISNDEERWVASLHWPIDPADIWWSGGSVFISYTDNLRHRRERKVCYRFPAFLADHSRDSSMLLCLHRCLADFVWTGRLSHGERDEFDALDAFCRLWEPIGKQLSIRNSSRG